MCAPGTMLKPSDDFVEGLSLEEIDQRAKDIAEYTNQILYSKRYNDDLFEYRYYFGFNVLDDAK